MTQKFVTDEDVENDLRKQRSSENRTFSSNKHWKCRGKLRRFLSYMKAYKAFCLDSSCSLFRE